MHVTKLNFAALSCTAVEYLGTSGEQAKPLVVFPGGGLFFWWQAGYVLYMQQHQQSLLEVLNTERVVI